MPSCVPCFATSTDSIVAVLKMLLSDVKSISIYCSEYVTEANYVVQFYQHRSAALAKRLLSDKKTTLFPFDVTIDWINSTTSRMQVCIIQVTVTDANSVR